MTKLAAPSASHARCLHVGQNSGQYTMKNCSPHTSISACTHAALERLSWPFLAVSSFAASLARPIPNDPTTSHAGNHTNAGKMEAAAAPNNKTANGAAQSASRPYARMYAFPHRASAASSFFRAAKKTSPSQSSGSFGRGLHPGVHPSLNENRSSSSLTSARRASASATVAFV